MIAYFTIAHCLIPPLPSSHHHSIPSSLFPLIHSFCHPRLHENVSLPTLILWSWSGGKPRIFYLSFGRSICDYTINSVDLREKYQYLMYFKLGFHFSSETWAVSCVVEIFLIINFLITPVLLCNYIHREYMCFLMQI